MRSRTFLSPVILLALLAGCRGDGVGAGEPSWFRASLAGEVNATFEGTGDFSFQRDYAETPYYFTIYARGPEAELEERFYIRWPVTHRPGVGTYPLVPFDHVHGSTTGVTARYRWRRGDNVTAPAYGEQYVASSGQIKITRSTPEVVEGTIHFSGIQISRSTPSGPQRQDRPDQVDPAAPRIEVEGTFRAPYWPGFGTP